MSSQPTVVQGVVVGSPYEDNTGVAVTPEPSGNITKGEKQPKSCRDIPFAILFYIQLAAIIACSAIYGPAALRSYQIPTTTSSGQSTGSTIEIDPTAYLKVAAITGVVAIILSGTMFFIMMCMAEFLIKFALIFEVALSGIFAVLSFLSGSIIGGIFGLIFFALGVCYARAVWSRIPFATTNLVTSLTAVKANCGVTIVAYTFALLSVVWFWIWALAFTGIGVSEACDSNTGICNGSVNGGILFALFLSFFFTAQVIQNCVHVTVAGVVGTWWFAPEDASSCCSGAVCGSTFRAVTTSFGSICFGSLIVAFIQALRQLANSMRDEQSALACIADCILGCIESLIEYFNKWAYIYVGLYGYSYLQAGKQVFTLFKDRGWDAIVADDLVSNVLGLLSLVCGLITGGIGLAIGRTTDWFDSLDNAGVANDGIAFAFGLVVGLVLCSVLMSVVGSGVNTVIVCFAEGPAEFQQNHPELSNRMVSTWRGAFPGSI